MRFRFWLFFNAIVAGLAAAGLALSSAQDNAETVSPDELRKDGILWVGLFLANPENPIPPPNEKVARFVDRLRKAFPEQDFTLVGETEQAVFSEYESWVVPSKDLFLKIDSKGVNESGDGLHLHVQLWQRKNVLLKTDAILRRRPLFIECPRWRQGRAVMVLELLEKGTGSEK